MQAISAGEGWSFPVLAPARQGSSAEGYQVRDIGGFLEGAGRPGEGTGRKGAARNAGGRPGAKSCHISFSFATGKRERAVERTVTREYAQAKLAEKAALYRDEVGTGSSR
jgi:hypothetical protein